MFNNVSIVVNSENKNPTSNNWVFTQKNLLLEFDLGQEITPKSIKATSDTQSSSHIFKKHNKERRLFWICFENISEEEAMNSTIRIMIESRN